MAARSGACKLALLLVDASGKTCRPMLKVTCGSFIRRNYSLFGRFDSAVARTKGIFRPVGRGFRMQSKKVKNTPKKDSENPVELSTRTSEGRNAKNARSKHGGSHAGLSFALKTAGYTAGLSALVFGGCALWQQKNMRRHHEEFWNRTFENQAPQKRGEIRNSLNDIWNHLTLVHKVTYGIIGVNLLVLMAWKFSNIKVMKKWFTLSNTSNYYVTMFSSMFSHQSVVHFYLNMYVLSSFCVAWKQLSHSTIGDSNINGHERYLAFYLTAGMCSSLLSVLLKSFGRIPQSSLGASGAIMGLIGYTCEKMPNNIFSIVFLPNWTFSANSAKHFLIAFDTVGLLIGAMTAWRYIIFDHAGHLGGMLFGIWYANRGEKLLDRWSQHVMHLRDKK